MIQGDLDFGKNRDNLLLKHQDPLISPHLAQSARGFGQENKAPLTHSFYSRTMVSPQEATTSYIPLAVRGTG